MSNISHCRPVLEAEECAGRVLSSEVCDMSQLDPANFMHLQQSLSFMQLQQSVVNSRIVVNHVCRENVEGFDCSSSPS